MRRPSKKKSCNWLNSNHETAKIHPSKKGSHRDTVITMMDWTARRMIATGNRMTPNQETDGEFCQCKESSEEESNEESRT